MNTIKIETLTPVHIGSGEELQGNFEYLYFPEEEKVAVIDAAEILSIIGEENMFQWIECIERKESLKKLIDDRKKDLKAEDIAIRVIPMKTATKKPIRIQIHGGEKPLLPGSSLKGAIRTVVWADYILESPKRVSNFRDLKDHKGNWSDRNVAKGAFGVDPNHDIFRLLRVGDASFSKTEAFETNVINKYYDDWGIEEDLTQIVEAIPAGQSASIRLEFNEQMLNLASSNYFNKNSRKLDPVELFPLINTHTIRLIDDEINYWDEKAGNPVALEGYIDELERILNIADSCAKNECVIRLGWGTGFRTMTGDWHIEMHDDDYYRLVKSLRPHHPDDLIFPKTTRFIQGGIPMGFLKMSF